MRLPDDDRFHEVDPTERCDGIKWWEVPLKALYRWGPRDENGRKVNDPLGLDDYRCKRRGRYRFDPVDGTFCHTHLRVAYRDWWIDEERNR